MIVTPFFILNNLFYFLKTIGMEPVPAGAKPPSLSEMDVERIQSQMDRLIDRLNAKEPFDTVIRDTASIAGVTQAQVILYLRLLQDQAAQQKK